jgi:hypothetical protein
LAFSTVALSTLMSQRTEVRSFTKYCNAFQHTEPSYGPVAERRATEAAKLRAVRAAEALVGRDASLVEADRGQCDGAHELVVSEA